MTKLSKDDVLRLARLASIEVDEDKASSLAEDMQNIIGYVELLNDVDVSGLLPTEQVTGLVNIMRPDEVIDYEVSQVELLKNAPASSSGQIKVRRVL